MHSAVERLTAAHPSLHPLHLGTFIRVDAAPGKECGTVRRTGALEPEDVSAIRPLPLQLRDLGPFPHEMGYQGLSPEFTVRKKSGHECIS